MINIILNGYLGQMGLVVTSLVEKKPDMSIVAGIDVSGSRGQPQFPTFSSIFDCDMPADCIIDFSVSSAVGQVIEYAVLKKIPAIICTTGLDEKDNEKILKGSKETAIFKSANMSLGINILANMLSKVSKTLYEEGFDIEIIDKHHNRKVDAPSGTAYLLADTVNASVGGLEYVFDRSTVREKRRRNELGLHSIRAGTLVGEHSVIFLGQDEMIELKHEAFSKEVFAVGALKAAKFIKGKPPGLYSMANIMEEL
jgi:4-hydroxy-tetrahydrodipicolinate reductase